MLGCRAGRPLSSEMSRSETRAEAMGRLAWDGRGQRTPFIHSACGPSQPAGHRVPGVRFCLACCGEGGSLHHVHQPAALSVVVAEVFGPPGKLDFSREVVLKEEQRDGR